MYPFSLFIYEELQAISSIKIIDPAMEMIKINLIKTTGFKISCFLF